MKSAFKPLFLAIALLLHAVLIAAGYFGFFEQKPVKRQPSPLTVSILSPPSTSAASVPMPAKPAPPLPVPPAVKNPEKPVKRRPRPLVPKSPAPKPAPEMAKPIPVPRASSAPNPPVAEAASPPATASPAPSSVPSPAAPVRAGVTISATYAASNPLPDYPALSRRYGEEGTVVLRVLVKEDGTAGDLKLKTSSGFPLLDKSAIKAVKTWRFNPATSDGKPIAEWYEVPIPFKLEK